MNLARHGKKWTDEEIDFISNRVGNYSIESIAKRIQRKPSAVLQMLEKIGAGNTKEQTDMLTPYQLGKILGVCNKTVIKWTNECGLKSVKRITSLKEKHTLISIESFWDWAKENKDKINFNKIERNALAPEPEWVESERIKDQSIPIRTRKKWTEKEDQILISMKKRGYSYQKIGEVLNRKSSAVKRRELRLKKQGKIPYDKINIPWTDEEIEIMLQLENKGYSDAEIAFELGREVDHIRWKRSHLKRKKVI